MGADKPAQASSEDLADKTGAYEPQDFGPHEARVFLQRFGLDGRNADPISGPLCAALLNASRHIDALSIECGVLKEELAKTTGKLERAEANMDTDALTGLGNRRGFTAVLNRMIKRRERNKDAFPKAFLVFIDMNDFRTINDKYTHQGGDEALVHVGKIIRANVREGDYVARVGGDEFAVILYDVNRREAEGVAKKIMTGVLDNKVLLKRADCKDAKKPTDMQMYEDPKLSVTCGLHKLKKSDTPDQIMFCMSSEMKQLKKKAKGFAAAYIAARDSASKRPTFDFD